MTKSLLKDFSSIKKKSLEKKLIQKTYILHKFLTISFHNLSEDKDILNKANYKFSGASPDMNLRPFA